MLQLSNVGKQHEINSFQLRNVELWPISSGSHMPLTTVPSREAEKAPKATSLASENTTVWVGMGRGGGGGAIGWVSYGLFQHLFHL